jgi:hypothetical protein
MQDTFQIWSGLFSRQLQNSQCNLKLAILDQKLILSNISAMLLTGRGLLSSDTFFVLKKHRYLTASFYSRCRIFLVAS